MNGYEPIDPGVGLQECPVCFAAVGRWNEDAHAGWHRLRGEEPPAPSESDLAWKVDRRADWRRYYPA